MNDITLHSQPELTQGEETDGLIPVTSDDDGTGRWRWKKIRGLAESLFRRNPLEVILTPTTLFENLTATAPLDSNFSETYNLDIRTGSTRHRFNDGYTFFEIYIGRLDGGITSYPGSLGLIAAHSIVNSSNSSPYYRNIELGTSTQVQNFGIYMQSNTSFRIGGRRVNSPSGFNDVRVCRIVGWAQTVQPESI